VLEHATYKARVKKILDVLSLIWFVFNT
jgi:hypothetical protein